MEYLNPIYQNGLQLMHIHLLLSAEISTTKLIREAKGQLGMLEHVVEAQILNLVLGGVDMIIGIGERTLDDESTRVSSLARGRMIGAGISAFSEDVWDITVLESSRLASDRGGISYRIIPP